VEIYLLRWITIPLSLHFFYKSGFVVEKRSQESRHGAAFISVPSGGFRTALLRRHSRSRVLAKMPFSVDISH